jgi:TolB protein
MALQVLRSVVGLLLLAQASMASAALSIEIIGAGEHQIPVAIVPFGGDDKLALSINAVIVGDLQRSGLFRMVDPIGKSPHQLADVSYPDWQVRGADALVIGSVALQPNGRIEANFRLLDVVKQAQLIGQSVSANGNQVRAVGHRISDLIYQKLTGDAYRLCKLAGKRKI